MIIDAHNHPDWHGHDLEKFLANMRQYKIDVTWLLTWESPRDEYAPSTNRVLSPLQNYNPGPIPFSLGVSYVQRAPGKFVLGYAPDPRQPDSIDRLEAAIAIHGVKVYGELKLRMMYDNPDALRMFRFCGKKKLPVTVHLDYDKAAPDAPKYPRPGFWYGGGIEPLERALQACPETIFLGHAPGFWGNISGDGQHLTVSYPKGKVTPGGKVVEYLRKYPNLYCDISAGSGCGALSRDPEFAREFLLEFQDRVLYARDYFYNGHQELINSLNLPQPVLDKIYAGNALKLAPLGGNANS